MVRLRSQILIVATLMLASVAFGETESGQKMKSRLEQLFIWRVSDRLQLTPDEESKFTAEYKKLSDERAQTAEKMEDVLNKLSDEKDKKARVKLLASYEEALKKFNQTQQDEMAAMKKIFGLDKFADYVLLKRDMLRKFRDVLTTNPSTDVAKSPDKLKPPQVTEEK